MLDMLLSFFKNFFFLGGGAQNLSLPPGASYPRYATGLKCLNLYSLQRRRDRYTAISVWKIMEEIVPNLSPEYV